MNKKALLFGVVFHVNFCAYPIAAYRLRVGSLFSYTIHKLKFFFVLACNKSCT